MQQFEPQQFATWAEPVDMLYACHSKVKRFCKQLQILPAYLAEHGVNQAVKNDVQQILTYFNVSAPLHHEDEERDFFPALVAVYPQAQEQIDALESQHIHLHQSWDALAIQLRELLEDKRNSVDEALIKRFISGYDLHIPLEEPLFELGKEHLSQEKLAKIGQVMAERRKIKG